MKKKSSPHRSGFVSLLGRPNAGKSTLLNALVGQKLAIVADKPQTTRTSIQAVLTTPDTQVIFLDTPGIHESTSLINRRMMQTIGEALHERDLLLYLIDVNRPVTEEDERAIELIKRGNAPAFAILNKIDRLDDKRLLLPLIERYTQLHPFAGFFPVSALTGEGLPALSAAILERLPEGPAYFPEDFVTDQPERFLAGELIREKILRLTRQEVPHAVAVLVDQWEEEGRLTRISATIYVERPGQKIIVLGHKGALLKRVGTEARLELESLLGRRIFLTLFVKVQPGWREHEGFLKELDWRAMLGSDRPLAEAAAEGGPPESLGIAESAGDEAEDGPVILGASAAPPGSQPPSKQARGSKPRRSAKPRPAQDRGASPASQAGSESAQGPGPKPQQRRGAKPPQGRNAKPQQRRGPKGPRGRGPEAAPGSGPGPAQGPGAKPQQRRGPKGPPGAGPKPGRDSKSRPAQRRGPRPKRDS
jgi:GTP-binding protein Era